MTNRLHELLKEPKLTWVFTGDSITHGCLHTNGQRNFFEHLNEFIRWDKQRICDTFINTGISGNTSFDLIEGFYHRIKRFSPHVVVIMIGMNDCCINNSFITPALFEDNINNLIDKIADINSLPILQTSNTIENDESRDTLSTYMDIIRKVCKKKGILLIDNHDHWLTNSDKAPNWLNDPIHPNGKGHLEIYNTILDTLELR